MERGKELRAQIQKPYKDKGFDSQPGEIDSQILKHLQSRAQVDIYEHVGCGGNGGGGDSIRSAVGVAVVRSNLVKAT